jgi:fatty acid kinase fatty acid binding subunit
MRPAVLIVDRFGERRRTLSEGLTGLGYECVPAATAEEGLRFAKGLEPGVIVAAADLAGFGDAGVLDTFSARGRRTLVLVGEPGTEPGDLPDDFGDFANDVRWLTVSGLGHRELLRRVRLVLVGREVGVEPDYELGSLVGELSLRPLLEVVRALHESAVSGRVELTDGEILFDRGAVATATAGAARGLKAFLRLSRRSDGPFRIVLGAQDVEHEIRQTVPELVLEAVEESQIEVPDAHARLRLLADSGRLDAASADLRSLLQAVERCDTVGDLLDAMPATDGRIAQALAVLAKQGVVRLEKRRAAVTVVTDSSADLPAAVVKSHDLVVAPLSILFGDSVFRDGVDLKPRDFYKLLAEGHHHPQTQPPSEDELYELFCGLIAAQDVVAVHISGKLSQTVVNSRRAALRGIRGFDHLPAERHNFALEVVDSGSVSIGVGLLAMFAARMAQRGLTVFEIAHRLQDLAPRIHILFVVDTFDYLVRGGRIGKARALVGKLLGIRPILGVVDGEVAAVDRVRGSRAAHQRIVDLVRAKVDPKLPIVAGVAHAQVPASADRLRALIEEQLEVRELLVSDIGPVVGTHAGPGCVGCTVIQPTAEEWPLIATVRSDSVAVPRRSGGAVW